MKDISLHILDITENATNAGASKVTVLLKQNNEDESLLVSIKDNGCGMPPETIEKLQNPFYTTRTTRKVGLGIPLLIQNAEQTGGSVKIKSKVGEGTETMATFFTKHLDCPPLGDLADVFVNLMASFSSVLFEFILETERNNFTVDSSMIEEVFGKDIAAKPEVLTELKDFVRTNINNVIKA